MIDVQNILAHAFKGKTLTKVSNKHEKVKLVFKRDTGSVST